MIPAELISRLDRIPRIALSHLPTPLEPLRGLTRQLSGPTIWVKRDDQTGLAFGGNKARKLEHIVADIEARGADTVVTWAGVQSNWCRQVAAAAAQMRIRCVLVLLKKAGQSTEPDGNLLLDHLFGAHVRVAEAPEGRSFLELDNVRELVGPVMEAEEREGRNPYLVPVGGSLMEGDMTRPLGALGYVRAFAEIMEQAAIRGFTPRAVVLATGSAGTQAGLLAGARLLSPSTRIVGVSVAGDGQTVSGYVKEIGEAVFRELAVPEGLDPADIIVLDEYLAKGYGVLVPEVVEAVRSAARDDGLLLDPVYTGKSMWALKDLVEKGVFQEGEDVVFLHTGGTPALFPYRDGLSKEE